MIASRRSFLLGGAALLSSPAIVRAGALMPAWSETDQLIAFVRQRIRYAEALEQFQWYCGYETLDIEDPVLAAAEYRWQQLPAEVYVQLPEEKPLWQRLFDA